jgi:hypothetical protein
MYNIVTSLNKKYWELGSNINIRSWDENFPKHVTIHIFSEDDIPDRKTFSKRIKWYNLYKESPELVSFIEKHKNNTSMNGQADVDENKKFKWNAIKFAHKTFSLFNIFNKTSSGSLIWLDSDVLAIDRIDDNFLKKVCPKNMLVSFLGRPTVYSECGWVYYNLDHPQGRNFLEQFEEIYSTDKILSMEETHDSFIFDVVRNKFDQSLCLNLNAGATSNKHPFHLSSLREKLIHNKGYNKTQKQAKFLKRYKLQDKYL